MVSQAYAYVKTQQIIRFKYVRPIAPQFFKNLNDLPGRDEPDPNEKPLDSSHWPPYTTLHSTPAPTRWR